VVWSFRRNSNCGFEAERQADRLRTVVTTAAPVKKTGATAASRVTETIDLQPGMIADTRQRGVPGA
jgi:hypothetical protein